MRGGDRIGIVYLDDEPFMIKQDKARSMPSHLPGANFSRTSTKLLDTVVVRRSSSMMGSLRYLVRIGASVSDPES